MRNGTARKDFSDIQIHNIITLATRVRIHIMKVIKQKPQLIFGKFVKKFYGFTTRNKLAMT